MQKDSVTPATKNSTGDQKSKNAKGANAKCPFTLKASVLDATTTSFIQTKTKHTITENQTMWTLRPIERLQKSVSSVDLIKLLTFTISIKINRTTLQKT